MAEMTGAWPRDLRGRLARALPILPVLLAEAILWLGFGALAPVLPLYLTGRGMDPATLGFIVAAWPAARLLGEPIFGWLADRTDKRALMLVGLISAALVVPLPLIVDGAPAFILARALAGLATAAYDPAARGYIMDATSPRERGEMFGLYTSAQMGGVLFGPAFGAIGAAFGGGLTFPFIFSSIALSAAALALALTTFGRPLPRHAASDVDLSAAGHAEPAPAGDLQAPAPAQPVSLLNRLLVAVVVINVGSLLAAGANEAIWSLWLTKLGGSILFIGLCFAAFGLSVLLVAPLAGRWIDRLGPLRFIVLGTLASATAALMYGLIADPWLALPASLLDGLGFALLVPALFALVARAAPAGRSATAQGLFGGTGTLGMIVGSITGGMLFAVDIRLPFFVFAATMVIALALGLRVAGSSLRMAPPPAQAALPSVGGARHVEARGEPAGAAVAGEAMSRPLAAAASSAQAAASPAGPIAHAHAATTSASAEALARPASTWLAPDVDPADLRPVVLVVGGLLGTPCFYQPLARSLLERGAADAIVAPVYQPDWALAAVRGLGPITTRVARALLEAGRLSAANPASLGAPILYVGHSAGGLIGRLLTSPVPFEGRRFNASGRIGALVTLGTPHLVREEARWGRQIAAVCVRFANQNVPGALFAPTTTYLAVAGRPIVGRADGAGYSHLVYRLYSEFQPMDGESLIEGDGLVPVASALLPGAHHLVLDDALHGTFGPWFGHDVHIDAWWPVALELWRDALRARREQRGSDRA
jgi:DHA1 family multidrug resistance protein-like MFS transporter